jgi:hypothetical protein
MERVAGLNGVKDADRQFRSARQSTLHPPGRQGKLRKRGCLAILGGRRFDRPQRDRSPPNESGWPRYQRCVPCVPETMVVTTVWANRSPSERCDCGYR